MLIGYARVSIAEQNLDLQADALTQAGCQEVLVDKMTGKLFNRPGLQKAMTMLRCGDTLVVWRLDRLGRSLRDLIELIAELNERHIGFRSLTEAIDTTSPSGKLIFHIFAALAEFERNLIAERTKAGMAASRARGRIGGRPLKLTNQQQEFAVKLYKEGNHSIKEICQIMNISKPTLYGYVKRVEQRSKQKSIS